MNTQHHNLLRSLTGDNSEIVLQFFVAFSRFEYALKRAGFLKNKPYAEADWDDFAMALGTSLSSITDIKFVEAKTYLLKHPPKKQIRNPDNTLGWGDNRQNGESETIYLLRLVRNVRNNLFHGGKYPNKAVSGRRLRNSRLLHACLTILEKCLSLDDDVKHFFEDAYNA